MVSSEEVRAQYPHWPYREPRRQAEEALRPLPETGRHPTKHRGMPTEARSCMRRTLLVSLSICPSIGKPVRCSLCLLVTKSRGAHATGIAERSMFDDASCARHGGASHSKRGRHRRGAARNWRPPKVHRSRLRAWFSLPATMSPLFRPAVRNVKQSRNRTRHQSATKPQCYLGHLICRLIFSTMTRSSTRPSRSRN